MTSSTDFTAHIARADINHRFQPAIRPVEWGPDNRGLSAANRLSLGRSAASFSGATGVGGEDG
jgi:hypothetical protein